MIDYAVLPDIMYFGAAARITELKHRVFLSPHIGIASLFIINTDDLFPVGYDIKCNLSYQQWEFSNELLSEPLKKANVLHNIAEFEGEVFCGRSSGYIHVVDISKVKAKLSLFDTDDPDREVIYNGAEPLPIVEYIPSVLEWDFKFSPEEVKKHGAGSAVRK